MSHERVLVAGFQHETNTFAPTRATYESFVRGEAFPAMVRGAHLASLREMNLPAGGFMREAERAGYTLLPVIWAGASPSAHVTEDAYERIAGEIVAACRVHRADGIYLDLHGAMVAGHLDDGEGELLERIRAVVGPDVPVVASLDLHANITQRMLNHADALVAYRTYPHVDMARTGARAAHLLTRLFNGGRHLHRVAKRLPFLIPINGMCTLLEPALGVYRRLAALEQDGIVSVSFAPGFPAADFPECGPVVWGYADDPDALSAAVDALCEAIVEQESAWEVPFLMPDEAVREAMRLSAAADRPVVIADTQDNPGAGGDSNTMEMVRALLRNGAQRAVVGLIWDAAAAAQAHRAGVGARIEVALGGTSGVPGDSPLPGSFEVVAVSAGRCRLDGPMMHGMEVDLGRVACLRIDGVLIAVSSVKSQMLDRNLYRVAGIEPEAMGILVNKSSVHFRADFEPVAHAVLVAKAPGPMIADPADLPWTRLPRGLRLRPMGPAFEGHAQDQSDCIR